MMLNKPPALGKANHGVWVLKLHREVLSRLVWLCTLWMTIRNRPVVTAGAHGSSWKRAGNLIPPGVVQGIGRWESEASSQR